MDVYGLTGGIGSGKSTVASLLEDYGIPVVSADELSRIVVAKGSDGLNDVVELFGPEVLDDKGELDRRKMAAIVFQEPHKRKELEAILHPRIRERFEQVLDALEKAGHEVAIYEVPLLFEKNLQGEMKAVLLVTADEPTRIARVKTRDDVTETEVRARIAAQMDEALKRKKADYIVENNGSMDDLRREVEFLLARFLRLGAHPEPDELIDRVTEVPVKTGSTIPPVPTEDQTAEAKVDDADDISRVKTLIPGGAGGPVPPAGVPRINPNAVRAESVPIPVAPTAPPTFGRPSPPPPVEPPATKPAPAKPARPSDVETPGPPALRKRDTAIPVRSGHTVIGPHPTPPPPPGEPGSESKQTRRSPTQPGRERKTMVATHVPHPPAPSGPTKPNVPPAPTPVPPVDSAPPPTPPKPPAPEPTAQMRRGSVPPTAPPADADGVPKTTPAISSQPPPAPARPAAPAASSPPPPPAAPVPRVDSKPPIDPGATQPSSTAQRPRTQTVRVSALTAEDLARGDAETNKGTDAETDAETDPKADPNPDRGADAG
jgi:dephospho-CoA kinase